MLCRDSREAEKDSAERCQHASYCSRASHQEESPCRPARTRPESVREIPDAVVEDDYNTKVRYNTLQHAVSGRCHVRMFRPLLWTEQLRIQCVLYFTSTIRRTYSSTE